MNGELSGFQKRGDTKTERRLVNEITDRLKSQGIIEVKYIAMVEGGRSIVVKYRNGIVADEGALDRGATDDVDTLFRLLEHLKMIPRSEEGEEVRLEVSGLTLKYEFWA